MAKAKQIIEQTDVIDLDFRIKTLVFRLVGTTPLLMHRQSAKAQQELLYPSGKKNAAEKATTLKHNPPEEFRASMYRNRDPNTPTLVHMPNGSFKKAIAQAAIDLPGAASKAQLGRLSSIANETVFIYGVPMFHMGMVRTAGMNRVPDVRTRAIFPQWCCELHVNYADILNQRVIEKLLIAAGFFVGIGDWRPERSGDFGKWRVVETADDEEYEEIVTNQGRAAQQAAYDNYEYYDEDSRELNEWWLGEFKRRNTDRDHSEPMPKVAAHVSAKTNGKTKQATT